MCSMHLDSHYILNHCFHSNVGYRSPLPHSTRDTCCAARFEASCNKGCDLNSNQQLVVLHCCRILGVSTVPVSMCIEECVYYRICTNYCILSYVNLFYIKYLYLMRIKTCYLRRAWRSSFWLFSIWKQLMPREITMVLLEWSNET